MTDYEKLYKLYSRIDELIDLKVSCFSPEFQSWNNDCVRFLRKYYGANSNELNKYNKMLFSHTYLTNDTDIKYIKKIKANFETLLEEMKDEETIPNTAKNIIVDKNITGDKIFIVHGHDEAFKYKTAHLLRKLGLSPVILHEQTNSGKTIIEKLEKNASEARAAIILFTPDDVGKAKTEEEQKARSRQNVVFEAGYFMGLLGRNNTMLIVSDKSIELPGDLSGIVYDSAASEFTIAKELKSMGLEIDLNKLA